MIESRQHSGALAVTTVTAVLFFLILLPFELMPEIPVDIDFKPFFVPLALCALLPSRMGLPIGLGVALGEGMRDLMEGYELDDPIGFFGYVAGFYAASKVYAFAPRSALILIIGAIICGFVQAAIEASSFLLFGAEGIAVTIESTLGNTLTHGVILGAIPLLFLVPALQGKFEHYLGFAPRSMPPLPPLQEESVEALPSDNSIAAMARGSFRYPGQEEASFLDLSLEVRHGDCLSILSSQPKQADAVGLVLAGISPRLTGGDLAGAFHLPKRVGFIARDPSDMTTQPTAEAEVASMLLIKQEDDPVQALHQARSLLNACGVTQDETQAYIWTLPWEVQYRVHIAVARAAQPDLLLLQTPEKELNEDTIKALLALINDQLANGAVVLTGNNNDRFRDLVTDVVTLDSQYTEEQPDREMNPNDERDAIDTADNSVTSSDTRPLFTIPMLQNMNNGWWQQRDPRIKWMMFLSLLLLIYLAPTWPWMAVMAALGLVLVLTARPPLFWLGLALFVQIPNILGLIFIPLLGDQPFTEEIGFGLRLGLGWVAAIFFGISLLSSMSIPQTVLGLRGLGLPKQFCAVIGQVFVMIYLSFRDIARLSQEAGLDKRAFSPMRPVRLTSSLSKIFIPSIISVARRSAVMSIALDLKDYGKGPPPVVPNTPSIADGILLLTTLMALSGAVIVRLGII